MGPDGLLFLDIELAIDNSHKGRREENDQEEISSGSERKSKIYFCECFFSMDFIMCQCNDDV